MKETFQSSMQERACDCGCSKHELFSNAIIYSRHNQLFHVSLLSNMASLGFPQVPFEIINGGAYAPAAATLLSLLLFLWVLNRFSLKSKSSLPPGPFAWPIIGNLNHLWKNLPHRNLHELGKKYGPIMMLRLGSVPTVVVSSSAMAKEFLKTYDQVFASRPLDAPGKYLVYNYKDMVFAPYGPYWKHIRKLCVVELLSAKRVESFSCIREEVMLSAVRSVWEMSEQGKKAVNLCNVFASFAQEVMWLILSGAKLSSSGEEIKQVVVDVMVAAGAVNIGDFIPYLDWLDLQGVKGRLRKVSVPVSQLIRKIIEERKVKLGEEEEEEKKGATKGIIDVLLEMGSLDGRPITKENIEAIVFDMFLAGIETTSTTLEWAMSEILRNPKVLKKMQEEIDLVVGREGNVSERDSARMEYVQCVVKETLRLYPALPLLLPHESIQDCTIGGYFIPGRSRVIVNAWAIGRDPLVWKDPLEFMPERFMGKKVDVVKDKEYFDMIPFGAGRRGCPGAAMADVSMSLVLAQLVHCFNWSVDGELDMTELFGITTPRSVHLLARPTLRLSTCP